MFILGALIAIGAALVFAAVGLLTVWGGAEAVSREFGPSFVRTAASALERVFAVLLVALPIAGVALLALLAAWRIAAVAMGQG
jgi:hypothetical protein